MNVDESLPPDEQFASVLAAWDEALAEGAAPGPATGGSPELWSRLERGLACLQRLQGLRPRDRSTSTPITDTPRLNGPVTEPDTTARNLLFGVLALRVALIDQAQLVEACTLWTARKDVPLADTLVERGWLTAADRDHVEWLLERQLRKHRGDAHAGLAAVANSVVRHALSALNDGEVLRSLAALPPIAPEPDRRYNLTRLHATGGIGRVWLA